MPRIPTPPRSRSEPCCVPQRSGIVKNPNVASGSLLLPAQEPRINSESFENQLRNIVLTSPDLLPDRAPLDYSKGLFWNFKLLCFVAEGKKGVPAPTSYLQHSSESDSRQGLQ